VPKEVAGLIIVINCILLSEYVGDYSDCKNMYGRNNIKIHKLLLSHLRLRLPQENYSSACPTKTAYAFFLLMKNITFITAACF
jgi:hypothetical protein